MRSLWLSLHERLVHSTEDLTFQRRFQTLARSNPALAPFADPGALLALLHGRDAEAEEKNRVLAALVAESQAGGLSGEAAQTMLWLALKLVEDTRAHGPASMPSTGGCRGSIAKRQRSWSRRSPGASPPGSPASICLTSAASRRR